MGGGGLVQWDGEEMFGIQLLRVSLLPQILFPLSAGLFPFRASSWFVGCEHSNIGKRGLFTSFRLDATQGTKTQFTSSSPPSLQNFGPVDFNWGCEIIKIEFYSDLVSIFYAKCSNIKRFPQPIPVLRSLMIQHFQTGYSQISIDVIIKDQI